MSATWDLFVSSGLDAARRLEEGVTSLPLAQPGEAEEEALVALGFVAYALASQSLLVGAEDVGRLALSCEKALDHVRGGVMQAETGIPVLASSVRALVLAFEALAAPDRSGARTEGVPVEAARYELETFFPVPGRPAPGRPRGAPDVPASALSRPRPEKQAAPEREAAGAAGAVWAPDVDDDMIELFFEEVEERIETLSAKLLEIEKRPGDAELLRDIFRDLHTIKGSSAMVALEPMKDLAHAAEDLVGQLRDGTRAAAGPVIDALLGALDAIRDVAALASRRKPLDIDLDGALDRLRDPETGTSETAGSAIEPEAKGDGRRSLEHGKGTIRVDFDKLDRLMNLVGELVLGRDGLRYAIGSLAALSSELSSDRPLTGHIRTARRSPNARPLLDRLGEELGRVERVLADIAQELDRSSGRLDSVSGELRESVMKLRMVPVGGTFRKHHRTVRDLANAIGKRARLELAGEETELDKLLVEALDEPLMHLVRNSVDHGIEPPEVRLAAGKPPEGVIRLSAMHRGNQVVIRIEDDGKGIDPEAVRRRARERDLVPAAELEAMDEHEVLELIFRAGFSTAEVVSEISGRGVGMDVVRQTVVSRLKGTIDIESRVGVGSAFTLRLPLTLAIIQVLLARAGGEVFAIPLDAVVRTTTCRHEEVQLVQDREVLAVRDRQVPLIRLADVLELAGDVSVGPASGVDLHVVLTEAGGELCGLVCDGLVGKREIVIKPLGDLLEDVPCAAGATLLGDRCAIILDVPAIVGRALQRGVAAPPARAERSEHATPAEDAPHVLLVEDSDIMRESLRRLIANAGYRVTAARDGVEALELSRTRRFDLVSTDVMMPRMDGYELTRALRATPEYKDVPIVMVTSRGERIDRVRGFDAGVDEYITKPHDRHQLLRAIAKLLDGGPRGGPGGGPRGGEERSR